MPWLASCDRELVFQARRRRRRSFRHRRALLPFHRSGRPACPPVLNLQHRTDLAFLFSSRSDTPPLKAASRFICFKQRSRTNDSSLAIADDETTTVSVPSASFFRPAPSSQTAVHAGLQRQRKRSAHPCSLSLGHSPSRSGTRRQKRQTTQPAGRDVWGPPAQHGRSGTSAAVRLTLGLRRPLRRTDVSGWAMIGRTAFHAHKVAQTGGFCTFPLNGNGRVRYRGGTDCENERKNMKKQKSAFRCAMGFMLLVAGCSSGGGQNPGMTSGQADMAVGDNPMVAAIRTRTCPASLPKTWRECRRSIWRTRQVCPCTPGTYRCGAGLSVEICNATGTAWLYSATCTVGCMSGLCTGACTQAPSAATPRTSRPKPDRQRLDGQRDVFDLL